MTVTAAEQRQQILSAEQAPTISVNEESIPAALIANDRFVCWNWRRKPRADGHKWDKIPVTADGVAASSTNSATWCAYPDAVEAHRQRGYGIGYVLSGAGEVGIDLDGCRHPQTGQIDAWADDVIQRLDSYAEVSPSGTGVKVFVLGHLPDWAEHGYKRPDGSELEIWDTKRYVTLTGERVEGTPDDLQYRQHELEQVLRIAETWAPKRPSTPINPQWIDHRAPAPSDDFATAKAALSVLDPDASYDDWLKVGMAIHAVSPGIDGEIEFDQWSRGGQKYVEGKPSRKWRSFNGGGGITLATLCHMADATGQQWRPARQTQHVNGQAAAITPATAANGTQTETPKRFRIDSITSTEFAAATYRLKFLIRKVFIADQPWIIGGAQKSMKTSVSTDAVISLGTGTPFLGQFPVPEPVPVGFISAESGKYKLQANAREIAQARGRLLSSANVHWYFETVQLGLSEHLDALCDWIRERELQVVIVDPAFLCCCIGDDGKPINYGNIFEVGPILRRFSGRFLELGCTPGLSHHESKGANSFRRRGDFSPPDLADLSMAGFAEWARQWMLLARREAYEHGSGLHRLWLNCGGSAGHGGLWAIDIDEGQLQDDLSGRKWEVTVSTGGEAGQEIVKNREAEKAERKAAQDERDLYDAVEKMRQALDANQDGLTFTRLRDGYTIPRKWIEAAADALVKTGAAERCDIVSSNKQKYPGIRLKCSPGSTGQHPASLMIAE